MIMNDAATTPTPATEATTRDIQPPISNPPVSRSLGNEGTLYAATQLSWEAGLFIEDACPMRYDIEDTLTWIVVGDTNTMLNLQLTDRALVNLASLTNQAAQAMLHERGTRVPHPISDVA